MVCECVCECMVLIVSGEIDVDVDVYVKDGMVLLSVWREELLRKIVAATTALERGLVEREMEMWLLLLVVCCGEYLLLFGLFGMVKSEFGCWLSVLCEGG